MGKYCFNSNLSFRSRLGIFCLCKSQKITLAFSVFLQKKKGTGKAIFASLTLKAHGVRIPTQLKQKSDTQMRIACFGGETGIRTLERVLAVTRFPVVRLRPAQPSLQTYFVVPSFRTALIIYHTKNGLSRLFNKKTFFVLIC